MRRAIDQPYVAGVDVFLRRSRWCIGLSAVRWVPRPRPRPRPRPHPHRYSRPNRASSRPSDAISLLHPSLYYPAINPSVPLGLSPTVLNRAGTLRCAISKFPADKKENRCSLLLPFPSALTHRCTYPVIRLSEHVSGHDSQRTVAGVIAAREEIPMR